MENAAHARAVIQFLAEQFVASGKFEFGNFQHALRPVAKNEGAGVTLLRGAFALLAQDADGFEGKAKSFHGVVG
jgi:hypothetical protein